MINLFKNRTKVRVCFFAKQNFVVFQPKRTIGFTCSWFTSQFIRTSIYIQVAKRMESKICAMANPPWREAASLIITSRLSLHEMVTKGKNLSEIMQNAKWNYANKSPSSDYRILMVKRSRLSSFMANAFVFPGGLVETVDYSPIWWSVFEHLGISREELLGFSNTVHGPRPPMITKPMTLVQNKTFQEEPIPSDVALRIAALRETFEETGILLLTNPVLETSPEATTHTLLTKNINTQIWQERIHNDPHKFIDLCFESGMCPDIWSLYEWSDWLTPTSVGHRRYDTMFYLCCLPRQPDVLLDQSEVTVMRWGSPEEMLEDNSTNTIFLAPPQVYELSRLLPIQSYHELHQFAKSREPKGCERWMPVISTVTDGALSLMPGDDLFPKEPDYEGLSQPVESPYTIDYLKSKAKNIHRMEIRGPQCIAYCSITPSCGHLQPLTYKSSHPIIQSYL